MMSAHQPITLDTRYYQLPGQQHPHPRNVATIAHLHRAWACAEFARIVAKVRVKVVTAAPT